MPKFVYLKTAEVLTVVGMFISTLISPIIIIFINKWLRQIITLNLT